MTGTGYHFALQSSIRINCPLLSRVVNTIRDQTVAYPKGLRALSVEDGGCVWEYIPDESLTDSS